MKIYDKSHCLCRPVQICAFTANVNMVHVSTSADPHLYRKSSWMHIQSSLGFSLNYMHTFTSNIIIFTETAN